MAEHAHLKNDFKENEKYHYLLSQLICSFLNVLQCWNKVMLIILLLPFVINPLFNTRFVFSLYHYGKHKTNIK